MEPPAAGGRHINHPRGSPQGAQRVSSFEGGIGIDATVPFAFKSDFRRARYPMELLDFRKWFTEREIEEMREQQGEYFRFLGKTGFA